MWNFPRKISEKSFVALNLKVTFEIYVINRENVRLPFDDIDLEFESLENFNQKMTGH